MYNKRPDVKEQKRVHERERHLLKKILKSIEEEKNLTPRVRRLMEKYGSTRDDSRMRS